ncbi:hypothetical protein AALA24_01845 [Anaerovoracaceae bacterium 42-11]
MKNILKRCFESRKRRSEEILESYLNPKPAFSWSEVIAKWSKGENLPKR